MVQKRSWHGCMPRLVLLLLCLRFLQEGSTRGIVQNPNPGFVHGLCRPPTAFPRPTALPATAEMAGEHVNRIWWVKMNEYQQQVWALSNALAGLLRDTEASKFPPTLRQKTRELQQSCDRLQHYIATSTSRIRKDVSECIEDLEAIQPSTQNSARLRRKLSNVEEYLTDISETFQSQESRAQDLEFEIRCLEDDFFRLQKETEQTTTGYEFGVKVFAVCAVVAFAAVAIPAIATAGGAAAAGTAAAEGAALTVGGATVAEGAAVAAGTAAVAEGAAVAAGTAAAVEGAAAAGISAEAVAVLSGGAALALKGGADGCRQLAEFLDRQQHSVSEHRGFVKQLETEIDVMKDDISNLEKRLNRASDAIEDDDLEDAARICGRLAGRLSELV
ncbi:unnamed protein product [Symbiodinium sp. CCMP2456]|nr:unnamed protein product [Symbiodinium sp. CCMP2456]